MPYIKPEELLSLQAVAHEGGKEATSDADVNTRVYKGAMDVCPVCGDKGCSKTIVEANNVFVHPEDVGSADEIDTPWR